MARPRIRPPARPTSDEERWSQVVQNLEDAIVTVDAEGRVATMNQAAEQLTGSSSRSAKGRPHAELFRNGEWVSRMLDGVATAEHGHVRAKGEISPRWGRAKLVAASASPLLDDRGRRLGSVVSLHDLTLQHHLDTDLQRVQSLNQFGLLVAGLAHEIKNPLSGIRGAVQLLDAELHPKGVSREYVDLVLREVDRLTRLLEQLLDLGSRRPPEREAVNIHKVIDDVIDLVGRTAGQTSVTISRGFDPSLPPVAGQGDSLTQVLLNLVQNAIQAVGVLKPGSAREVSVTTRLENEYHVAGSHRRSRRERYLRIEVADNGPGIPRAVQPSLFSPFFTTKPKGTGLGLAISHRIVTDHGGTIRFESEPGSTVFRVVLPAWEPAEDDRRE